MVLSHNSVDIYGAQSVPQTVTFFVIKVLARNIVRQYGGQFIMPIVGQSMVTGLRSGRPRLDSRQRQRYISSSLLPDQIWDPCSSYRKLQRLEREADEVNNAWISTPTYPYAFIVWCLIMHRHTFMYYNRITHLIRLIMLF